MAFDSVTFGDVKPMDFLLVAGPLTVALMLLGCIVAIGLEGL